MIQVQMRQNFSGHLQAFEEGRISIFAVRRNTAVVEEKLSIWGNQNGARFGHTLMALGDLVRPTHPQALMCFTGFLLIREQYDESSRRCHERLFGWFDLNKPYVIFQAL